MPADSLHAGYIRWGLSAGSIASNHRSLFAARVRADNRSWTRWRSPCLRLPPPRHLRCSTLRISTTLWISVIHRAAPSFNEMPITHWLDRGFIRWFVDDLIGYKLYGFVSVISILQDFSQKSPLKKYKNVIYTKMWNFLFFLWKFACIFFSMQRC